MTKSNDVCVDVCLCGCVQSHECEFDIIDIMRGHITKTPTCASASACGWVWVWVGGVCGVGVCGNVTKRETKGSERQRDNEDMCENKQPKRTPDQVQRSFSTYLQYNCL